MSDVFTPLAIKTIVPGGVSIAIDQTDPGVTNGVAINASLPAGDNLLGHVIVDSGSLTLGAGTASLGTVGLNAGSASIGNVGLNAGTASIGSVGLNAGTNVIGHVIVDSIATGTNSLGTVGLDAGTHLVGKFGIDQTTPGSTNGVQLTGPGTSSSNPIYVNTGDGTSGAVVNSGLRTTVDNSGDASDDTPGGTLPIYADYVTAGKIASLEHVVMSSSIPGKWAVGYYNASNAFVTSYVLFSSATNLTVEFNSKLGKEVVLPVGDGVVRFSINFTSSDPTSGSAEAYATFVYNEN